MDRWKLIISLTNKYQEKVFLLARVLCLNRVLCLKLYVFHSFTYSSPF